MRNILEVAEFRTDVISLASTGDEGSSGHQIIFFFHQIESFEFQVILKDRKLDAC